MKSKTKIAKNKKRIPLLDKKVIYTENKNIIKLRIPNTKNFVLGEQRRDDKWNIYFTDESIKYKKIIKRGITTESFSILSNVILKTPFPYQG